jgi:FKBP-type peptidyl-prolyl cis-trans isomerase FkpA
MSVKYLLSLVLFLLFGLLSCRNNNDRSVPVNKPGQDQMADLNRYFIQKDKERIQNYIERKKLKMKETPTGLWYQIINEGSGLNFADNDKLSFDYECSLLDGTKCYSSKELGPKEAILGRSDLEQGLNEGIKMLKPGAEAIFIIPPYLAYGLLGDRKNIPPRAVIVYNVYNLCAK